MRSLKRFAIPVLIVTCAIAPLGIQPASARGGDADGTRTSASDPASPRRGWQQAFPKHSPPSSRTAALAYDSGTGRMVMFGGDTATDKTDETWTWDGTDWNRLDLAVRPPARNEHAMAYDPVRREMVLFGGEYNFLFRDTWVFANGKWRERDPTYSPPALEGAVMAFDPILGKVILFGGYDRDDVLDGTWAWNGKEWKQLRPATSPPARDHAALAYDPSRGRLVLFGGVGDLGHLLGDTWTWDGSTWEVEKSQDSPWPRYGHAMTTYGEGVLMYGGIRQSLRTNGESDLHESDRTWLLKSEGWVMLKPIGSPPPKSLLVLGWDPVRDEAMLFGGGFYDPRTWVLTS